MRIQLREIFAVIAFVSVCSGIATACPDGQYRVCSGKFPPTRVCGCFPNPKTVQVALDPTPDVLNILGDTVKVNMNGIDQSVGHFVLATGCSGCAVLAQIILSKPNKAFLDALVGRGWILYATDGDPIEVVVDTATSLAYELRMPKHSLAQDPFQTPTPAQLPASRKFKVTNAICALNDSTSSTIGLVGAPILIDLDTGKTVTFGQGAGLMPGDSVTATAQNLPTDCASLPTGQSYSNSVTFVYGETGAFDPPKPTQIHYVMTGPRADTAK